MFLENWKRLQMRLCYFWDLTGLEEEEEHPRPEYETRLLQKKARMENTKIVTQDESHLCESHKTGDSIAVNGSNLGIAIQSKRSTGFAIKFCSFQFQPSILFQEEEEKLTWRDRTPGYLVNCASILFMISLTFSIVFGVIAYRITLAAALSMSTNGSSKSNVRVTVTATAVIINLVVILILDEIYGVVAKKLTEMGFPSSEDLLKIVSLILLNSASKEATGFQQNHGQKNQTGCCRGSWEVMDVPEIVVPDFHASLCVSCPLQCAPGGCLMELCIQLSIIMLGKQLIQNNIFEIGVPKLKKLFRKLKDDRPEQKESHSDPSKQPQQWELDYVLEPFTGLTPEYMEMIIQFGFVTLFVASFPLAPVFALLNNVIEVRLDAKKFVAELRRPDTVRAKDIGMRVAYFFKK
ncbi:hypothetical protein E2320_005906 [Naja naja]|nr:hypothetical protein E2320_005906 [Naja naja]